MVFRDRLERKILALIPNAAKRLTRKLIDVAKLHSESVALSPLVNIPQILLVTSMTSLHTWRTGQTSSRKAIQTPPSTSPY